MDYKELISGMRVISKYEKRREYNEINVGNVMEQAASAITDLLARAEAAEALVHELETLHRTEMCEDGYDCVELGKVRRKLAEAEARAEKAERERDAAIHDIFESASAKCFWCKHQDRKWLSDGKMDGLCFTCLKNNKCNWEWRGQREE